MVEEIVVTETELEPGTEVEAAVLEAPEEVWVAEGVQSERGRVKEVVS